MSNEKMFVIENKFGSRLEIRFASDVHKLIRDDFDNQNTTGEVFDKDRETASFFALYNVYPVEKIIRWKADIGLNIFELDDIKQYYMHYW